MAKIIMASDELVRRLEVLANQKTFYRNKWNYNVGLIAPPKSEKDFKDMRNNIKKNYNPYNEQAKSFDCSNLIKSLLNGYDVNKQDVGYYQADLSNTGDCNEYGLLKQCSGISTDFSKLKLGQPALLYMQGHVATYLGKEVVMGLKRYNVIECTTNFGGGVVYSWVDPDGTRRACKGGAKPQKDHYTQWGLFTPWVSYTVQPVQPTQPKVDVRKYPVLRFTKDKKGRYTTRGEWVLKLQKLLYDKGYDPNGLDSVFGPGCEKAVRQYQRDNGLDPDGIVGPLTWNKLMNG